MLTHLSIQGLAIIDQLTIDFTGGFNVITGETGAGKSILIKALSLLLGGKASPESVRRGCDQASVTGRFLVRANHPAAAHLRSIGALTKSNDSDYEVEIRRCVSAKGRSTAWVNEIPVTTGSLKDLAASLIDVFGQHDSHRLLDSQQHAICLDQFVEPRSLVGDLYDTYAVANETMSTLRQFVNEATGKGRDVDYLAFRLSEFEEFKPSVADYDAVRSLTERARSATALTSALRKAQGLLEDDDGDAISRRLREISRALHQVKSTELDQLAESAVNIASNVDELSYAIGRAAAQVEVSEEDVDKAESRIAGYQALFRKHNVQTADELCEAWQKLKEQVRALENASEHVHLLLERLESEVTAVTKASEKLASARRKAADVVAKRVEKELSDLAMPSAKFSVEFSPVSRSVPAMDLSAFGEDAVALWSEVLDAWSSVSEIGSERAEFYLAANKGEVSLPLAKVASGGEVSRIMLALKKALVVGAETCVLVFDEIDTGISGRVADIVGQKIAELSGYCQILCISHLPQVAAYADRHYVVQKIEGKDRTESTIKTLSDGDHLKEIARLLSGDKLTQASLEHAKSLVSEAKSRRTKVTTARRDGQNIKSRSL
jgi:DNA repair protein RecN (Recombination protein N)